MGPYATAEDAAVAWDKKALELREEALAASKRALPPGHAEIPMAMANLAESYSDAGRHEEAVELYADARAVDGSHKEFVKGALLKGQAHSTDDLQIKIKLVAPPLYVMTVSALDKARGIQLLADAIAEIEEAIKASKGALQVKVAPRAVDERDDKLLNSLMSTLDAQNQEEYEDALGNVLSKKTYQDLLRQGLL